MDFWPRNPPPVALAYITFTSVTLQHRRGITRHDIKKAVAPIIAAAVNCDPITLLMLTCAISEIRPPKARGRGCGGGGRLGEFVSNRAEVTIRRLCGVSL